MAWIQIDDKLSTASETLSISLDTGLPVSSVIGALAVIWLRVDAHGSMQGDDAVVVVRGTSGENAVQRFLHGTDSQVLTVAFAAITEGWVDLEEISHESFALRFPRYARYAPKGTRKDREAWGSRMNQKKRTVPGTASGTSRGTSKGSGKGTSKEDTGQTEPTEQTEQTEPTEPTGERVIAVCEAITFEWPQAFRTPKWFSLWKAWVEKGNGNSEKLEQQADAMRALPYRDAVECVETAITNNWRCLYPRQRKHNQKRKATNDDRFNEFEELQRRLAE